MSRKSILPEGAARKPRGRRPMTPEQKAKAARARAAELLAEADELDGDVPVPDDYEPESYDDPEYDTPRAAAPPRRQGVRPMRESPRDAPRESTRSGAVIAKGRDGEMLTRRRTTVGDIHHIPANEIPRGWDYQWNAVSVHGAELREEQAIHRANGWRPVPASRHPGRWFDPGFEGQIVVKGLRLEERPSTLGAEAREEDIRRARQQVRTQTDQLKMTQKQLPGANVAARRQQMGMSMKMSIDPALDIPESGGYLPADDGVD